MTIKFFINYNTEWGEELFITGSSSELGGFEINSALKLKYNKDNIWSGEIKLDGVKERTLSYKYFIKNSKEEIYFEAGRGRCIAIGTNTNEIITHDQWQGNDIEAPFLSAPFTQVFYGNADNVHTQTHIQNNELIIRVTIPNITEDDKILISGNIDELGNWNAKRAVKMNRIDGVKWEANIQMNIKEPVQMEYKFIKCCGQEIFEWEECQNRKIIIPKIAKNATVIFEHSSSAFNPGKPKFTGCVVPLFSLKSKWSTGVGDFKDLRLLVDWVAQTGKSLIQLLPINDTSGFLNYKDSYPYNCISVFALHPIYINLEEMGHLNDDPLRKEIHRYGNMLNHLVFLDYEEVLELKMRYFKAIYKQEKENTFAEPGFYNFMKENKDWLYPYVIFCVLRDKYKTPDYGKWKDHDYFSQDLISYFTEQGSKNKRNKEFDDFASEYGESMNFYIFLQYHAHKQMAHAKEYAHSKKVALKGDIPIGVARYGVDAWQYPQFFNFKMQAGAPPDMFTDKGQIWGFPTYNWDEMEKDNYNWWKRRLVHLKEYFDAYRIDHVLGFFRIWEVPEFVTDGSKGHFYPVIPLTEKEITDKLHIVNPAKFTDLFVKYPYVNATYHPAIRAQYSSTYKALSQDQKNAYNALYNDFFYRRNEDLWYNNAKKKLQQLIAATDMLPCAEDLGMISDAVHKCLDTLKILSLKMGGDPAQFPYLSVCTTSTHDMETMRMQMIRRQHPELPADLSKWIATNSESGDAIPVPDVSPEECQEELNKYLKAPSMLAIFPIQDWLSVSMKERGKYADSERINDPGDSNHYWRYRMSVFLDDLV